MKIGDKVITMDKHIGIIVDITSKGVIVDTGRALGYYTKKNVKLTK